MSPAPLRSAPAPFRSAPAIALALLVLLAAAAAAPQQLPARTRPDTVRTRAHAKTAVSGRERAGGRRGEVDFGHLLGILTGPQLQLVGPMYFAQTSTLAQLSALIGADTVLPLFEASVGASSGGYVNPAAVGTNESSEEVADLVV